MSVSRFPTPPNAQPATSLADCDAALARLQAARQTWVDTTPEARIDLLRGCVQGMLDVADAWVADCCKAKGLLPGSGGEGEEWLGGVMPTVRNLRLLIEAMQQGGQPPLPGKQQRADGQWIADVFPTNLMDKVLFTGFSAQIWIEPGHEPTQGQVYRDKRAGRGGKGGVSCVLGAGNQASIGPMDVLTKLFSDDEVCILKMHPVNEYLGPHIEQAFAPLIAQGFLAVVYGGAEVGGHLVHHAMVDSVHITGSDRTHDAIVWGSDPDEQARRKAAREPIFDKEITSELGCVTPILVVPGPWSASDLDFQARQIVSMVTANASFNCNAGKVLVLAKGWDQRDRLVALVKEKLAARPSRKAYYPGAQQRYDGFLRAYPQATALGERSDEVVPWTVIEGVGGDAQEYAFCTEAFCGVLVVADLEAQDAAEYLAKAVPFANDTLWGTLSANILVHPKTEKAHRVAVEEAVADLRYGGIGFNCWSGVNYGLVVTTWGAFPGHPLEDIESGRGVVHNTFLLDHPQKSVVRAPFRMQPTPAWFTDHKNGHGLGRKLTWFEADPGWGGVPGVAFQAMKG